MRDRSPGRLDATVGITGPLPITVAVCTRNRPRALARLLNSMCRMRIPADLDWRLLVVDNGDDDLPQRLAGFSGRLPLRVIREPRAGLSHARNAALDACAGEHVVWTDDDVTVPRDWLLVYERAFRFWPGCGFFGGPISARCEGSAPRWFDAVLQAYPEAMAHIDPTREFVELQGALMPFGANMGFRAGVLDGIRFDPALGRQPGPLLAGAEESAVLRELGARGVRGLWLPPAGVMHWIDAGRASARYLYDFFLGEAFFDEWAGCCEERQLLTRRIDAADLDARFARLGVGFNGDEDEPEAWVARVKSAATAEGRRLAWSLQRDHFRAARRHDGPRVMAIALDGFDTGIAGRLLAEGAMPNLRSLDERSARFTLDHGDAMYSGLAWEHFSSGREPGAGGRHSAVDFDPELYLAVQKPTSMPPFAAALDRHAVVFDVPYFDLERVSRGSGITHWGAHDPGVPPQSSPRSLATEIRRRFGGYPATRWIYGFTWPDPGATRALSGALVEGVNRRAAVGRWLLDERFPDWDLAMLAVGELHSATEPLWHGFDPDHPLHRAASSEPSWRGLADVYGAVDRLIGDLAAMYPDDYLVVFSMHGMRANVADLPAMLLLPELLYRAELGVSGWEPDPAWLRQGPDSVPGPVDDWSGQVAGRVAVDSRWLPDPSVAALRNLSWMPAERYCGAWSSMRAFALPSFYDGRIRVNLRGREARGTVTPGEWRAIVEEMAALVESCRDPATGEGVVESIHLHGGDPMRLDRSDADITIRWRGVATALTHPAYGTIGPAPLRRPGGHGGHGAAWLRGPRIDPGDRGAASSFDLAPTIVELLGCDRQPGMSGCSLAPRILG